MNERPSQDWQPFSAAVRQDQRAAYDEMLARCPVAYSDAFGWSLFRHRDILRVLHDHATFSNVVSQHLAVPNGMDPPGHTAYRRLIEPYFAKPRIDVFEPVCREIVAELVQWALASGEIELIAGLALPFAVRVQCAFLGWPARLHGWMLEWIRRQREAARAQDRPAMAKLARDFDAIIGEMLQVCQVAAPSENVTAELMREQVDSRPLRNDEIASIMRNWTTGEIGTISASIGILAQFLAVNPDVQAQLRGGLELLPEAIDEILRLYGPLVLNRRVTTHPVELGGRQIAAGERVSLMWMAGNRDGEIFEEPHCFRLGRDPDLNLLYGAGIHVCPGAPLARMELRVVLKELLARTTVIELVSGEPTPHATYPDSGYAKLPLRFR